MSAHLKKNAPNGFLWEMSYTENLWCVFYAQYIFPTTSMCDLLGVNQYANLHTAEMKTRLDDVC